MTTFQVLDWRPLRKNALLGFAKVQLPSGMVIHDVTILTGDRGAWASPPSKPLIGRDGTVIKDGAKTRYAPVIEFATKETRDRFSSGVIDALRASHPEVFDAPGS